MSDRTTELTDFHHQLAFMVKANLPLPEGLRRMAENVHDRAFRHVLKELGDETAKGTPLSTAMRRFPKRFPEFQVRLIEVGERNGTLPEVLRDVAFMARFNHQLLCLVKEVTIVPVMTILFAVLVFSGIFIYIVPEFDKVYQELLEGEPLPGLTSLVMSIGRFLLALSNAMSARPALILVILAVLVVFMIWLYGGSNAAQRTLLRLIRYFPFSSTIFDKLNASRFCLLWAFLMRQRIPAAEALRDIGALVENRRLGAALTRGANYCAAGNRLSEALAREKDIPGVVKMTVEHTPESELPDELARLGEIYRERACATTRGVRELWLVIMIVLMSLVASTVIIAMFLPLISIIEKLGGG